MKRQSLQYSSSSSSEKIIDQNNLQSKAHLLKNQAFQIQLSKVSVLDTLIKPKQLTYLDNHKLYGIVKVQDYLQLKEKLKQIITNFEKSIQENQDRLLQITSLETMLVNSQKQNLQKKSVIDSLSKTISQQSSQISCLSVQLNRINSELLSKNCKPANFSSIIQNVNLFPKNQIKASAEVQTEYTIPQIVINVNMQNSNQNKISQMQQQKAQKKDVLHQETLKEIIEQSLQIFTKELTNQAQFIKEQVLQMEQLQNQNINLRQQNQGLKKKLEEFDLDQRKLEIFKQGLSKFLNKTQKNIENSLKKDKNHQNYQNQQIEINPQNVDKQEQKINEDINHNNYNNYSDLLMLKKQNLSLMKLLGQQRNKSRYIEKLIQDSEQIQDDGVVGQLVKMSKLVKESIITILKSTIVQ